MEAEADNTVILCLQPTLLKLGIMLGHKGHHSKEMCVCLINVCAYMPLNEYTHLSISFWSLLTDLNLEMPAPMPTGVKQVCE